jgi:hypothetical protein
MNCSSRCAVAVNSKREVNCCSRCEAFGGRLVVIRNRGWIVPRLLFANDLRDMRAANPDSEAVGCSPGELELESQSTSDSVDWTD